MGGFVMLVLAAAAAWYLGIFEYFRPYTYRAEVGYYTGERQDWFVGDDKSREECIAEAVRRYNAMNDTKPGRAFSWACRKMQGETFLDRVR